LSSKIILHWMGFYEVGYKVRPERGLVGEEFLKIIYWGQKAVVSHYLIASNYNIQ
jgi:hypothetical protein